MSVEANLPKKVLIVDIDSSHGSNLCTSLEKLKISTVFAKSWEDALYLYRNQKIDICLVSLEIEGLSGPLLIQKWRQISDPWKELVPVILMVSNNSKDSSYKILLKEWECIAYTPKPVNPMSLLSLLSKLMTQRDQLMAIKEVKNKIIDPLIEKNMLEKAKTIVEEKILPLGEAGQFLYAQIMLILSEFDQAVKTLSQLAAKHPDNMSYLSLLGEIYLKKGALEDARKFFEKAEKTAPNHIKRMEKMAKLYLDLNMPDESLNSFRNVCKFNPEKPNLKYSIYEQFIDAGHLSHARALSKETSTPGELIKFYNNKGVLYSKEGNFEAALKQYQTAYKLLPDSKDEYKILFNMAIAHMNLKTSSHLGEARELLNKSIKIKPDYTKALEKIALLEKLTSEK